MSVFSNLLWLKLKSLDNPKEDYLTEIFVYCLKSNESLFKDFLVKFTISQEEIVNYQIKTQERFSKLKNHTSDSIPDIVFRFNNHTVFIECKIDAKEGDSQLQRYAEHLDTINTKKTLIFLTKNFEERDINQIMKNCQSEIDFIPLRWFEVYKLLNKYADNNLVLELLKFMKNMDLSSNNQFTPTDLITLANINNAFNVMQNCMWGKVSTEFEKKIGKLSATIPEVGVRRHNKYYYEYKHDGMYVSYGFDLSTNKDFYPSIFFQITFDPKRNEMRDILIAQEFDAWAKFNIDIQQEWFGIFKAISLSNIISSENNISKVEGYLIDWINEYCTIEYILKK